MDVEVDSDSDRENIITSKAWRVLDGTDRRVRLMNPNQKNSSL